MPLVTAPGYSRLNGSTLAAYLGSLPEIRTRLGGAPPAWRLREVSDGNLNLVYIAEGPAGSVCTKQPLPHVRVDENWQLPLQRTGFEVAYFAAVTPHAQEFLPAIYHYDPNLFLMVMENLTPHRVLRGELLKAKTFPRTATAVGEFVARATYFTSDLYLPFERKFDAAALFGANHALLRISVDLIFQDPYKVSGRNRWTAPQPDGIAAEFRSDAGLRIAAARMGHSSRLPRKRLSMATFIPARSW